MPRLDGAHTLVALITLTAASIAAAAEAGYATQPALHDSHLVFVSEGDLWHAALSDDPTQSPIIAYRLTSSDGNETSPVISPDGGFIAFAGQYDGNTDVYVMPITGGSPTRLTFHPGPDAPLAWSPDSAAVLFRSARAHHAGRTELWNVPITGGMPTRYGFGDCSQAATSSTGTRIVFTPWSNETWNWKGYRGGTAPEIWVGDVEGGRFTQLTEDPANDLFPMWLQGRVYFLSDRSGSPNIYSDRPQGGDLRQHTSFKPDPNEPTSIEGYDVRWPSAETKRRSGRIVFCQAGRLALLDVATNRVTRLDVRLASDRVATRQRFVEPMKALTEFTLSSDGRQLIVGTRGEMLIVDVDSGKARRLTRSSNAREWGATFVGDDRVALITDATGEQQIAMAPADASDLPSLATEDREDWLFPPVASPDGEWIAFGDRTARLHLLNTLTLERRLVEQSDGWEITDYRFSPDGQWLAYTRPSTEEFMGGYARIRLYSIATQQTFDVSDGLHHDREPRWDPAGKYLYFLSGRHFDPLVGSFEMEHVYVNTTRIIAVPLEERTPPPIKVVAETAGFDLKAWADPDSSDEAASEMEVEGDILEFGDPIDDVDQPEKTALLRLDTDRLAQRHYVLDIEPGNYSRLEAVHGGLLYLSEPTPGLLDDDFGQFSATTGKATLHHHDLVAGETKSLASPIPSYRVSGDRSTYVYPDEEQFNVRTLSDPSTKHVAMKSHRVAIDMRTEWRQIFEESWRLQRDFYWAPNLVGVDWPAMKTKYAALLDLVGTRAELNLVMGGLFSELGTSHAYIWGGEAHDEIDAVDVGMLGADLSPVPGGVRIDRILPAVPWGEETLVSPLGQPFLNVFEGDVILAVNGESIAPRTNIYSLLQDQAGKPVRLSVADNASGLNRRDIDVTPIASESRLRYITWVLANRAYVAERTNDQVGYVHIPDMGGDGLSLFSRQFFPQSEKKALIIDVRDNGGGFVSQMIISRLARRIIAFDQPRQGPTGRYPSRALNTHLAAIIDQHAGSDGDIFPTVFKRLGLGPLIGTRTWGGVVGIRADKPFIDLGLSTQPEFAWWEADGGWTLENTGVEPDIEVRLTPLDRMVGRDTQLDRAIEELLKALQNDPLELPAIPTYPTR